VQPPLLKVEVCCLRMLPDTACNACLAGRQLLSRTPAAAHAFKAEAAQLGACGPACGPAGWRAKPSRNPAHVSDTCMHPCQTNSHSHTPLPLRRRSTCRTWPRCSACARWTCWARCSWGQTGRCPSTSRTGTSGPSPSTSRASRTWWGAARQGAGQRACCSGARCLHDWPAAAQHVLRTAGWLADWLAG
jgi:hypothetical protein